MDPDEVKVLKAPDDWVDPAPNTAKQGANFDKFYNSRRCIRFSYRLAFSSGAQGGQYKARCLPDVYRLVIPNEEKSSIHTHEEWDFSTKVGRREKTSMV